MDTCSHDLEGEKWKGLAGYFQGLQLLSRHPVAETILLLYIRLDGSQFQLCGELVSIGGIKIWRARDKGNGTGGEEGRGAVCECDTLVMKGHFRVRGKERVGRF